MVLAKNKTRGGKQTFPTMRVFNMACEFHDLELLSEDYKGGTFVENEEPKSFEDIEIKEILSDNVLIHKDELKNYTVATFRDELKKFTKKELEVFIKFDERATIKNEAKKELKKRN